MNLCKVIGIISIFSASHFLQSAEENKNRLSAIEKQLVLREVAKRGKDVVMAEILKKHDCSSMKLTKNGTFSFTKPPQLEIQATFSHNEIERDQLAKNIFQEIEEMEKESGYCPESKLITKKDGTQIVCNNYLGDETRYYWVKEGMVEVKSHFNEWNTQSLLAIIQNDKD